jgi:Tfp pilus assembly PilM family ATPase
MAKLLAVEWDQSEVRYALAMTRGQQLEVVAAAATVIEARDDEPNLRAAAIGHWLRDELARHRWTRTETLVGLDRATLEVLHLALPPATDDELPELVRNQAMRESAAVTEDSLLDFVPLPDDSGDRTVTAMALAHEMLDEIRATCTAAGVTPKRMVVRPYATTSLVTRLADPADGICLLISRFAEEVDLTVVDQGNVVYWRTVQLPSGTGADAATDALLVELRRTLMVVQNQTGGDPIGRICILGDAQTHHDLVGKITEQLALEPQLIEPFRAVEPRAGIVPENSGRYAALLGMLLDEAEKRPPSVDFLHPRRKPLPTSRRRLAAAGAALVAVVLLAVGYTVWEEFDALDAQRQQLADRRSRLEQLVKRAAKQQLVVQAVRDWKSSDVVLLDELRDLSVRLPKARDMVVLRFSKAPSRSGWCNFNLQGLVRDPLVVSRMERNLRDQFHEIRSPRLQGLRQDEYYTWRFESSITVVAREKTQYLSYLPEPPPRQRDEKQVRRPTRPDRPQPASASLPPTPRG